MAFSVNKTRLEYFLEGYAPLENEVKSKILDRVYRASLSLDDPMSLQIAHDTILENRMASFGGKIAALPGQLDKGVQSALDKVEASRVRAAKVDRQAIAEQVAREATGALQAALPRFERTLHSRTVLRLVLTLALLSLVAGLAGYIWGRHDTRQLEEKFAELAVRADAKTWIRMLELNGNLEWTLSEACDAGDTRFFWAADGRPACNVPLWLDAPDMPTRGPLTVVDSATDHLVSFGSRSPFFVILGFGVLLGAALRSLPQHLWRWMGSGR